VSWWKQDPQTEQEFVAVPNAEIVEILDPVEVLNGLLDTAPPIVREFLDALGDVCGIPRAHVGIIGSRLVGMETAASDWDFVVFGAEHIARYLHELPVLRETVPLALVPADALERTALLVSRHLQISPAIARRVLARRRTKFQCGSATVSLNFEHHRHQQELTRIGKPVRRIHAQGVLGEDTNAFVLPRVYTVHAAEQTYTVVSRQYFFKEVALVGERVQVEGMLREGRSITVDEPGEYISAMSLADLAPQPPLDL
jgi:predicted nucleotidyltransferase